MCNCMKNKLLTIIIVFQFCMTFGQSKLNVEPNFEFRNSTGRFIKITRTTFNVDSSKIEDNYVLSKDNSVASGHMGHVGNIIRVDYIAVDDSTKDTLFVKSYGLNEINKKIFSINITSGTIEKLPQPLNPLPKLLFKAKGIENVMSLNDPIDLKLIDKRKVMGKIIAFDNESITLKDTLDKSITVLRKEIFGLKNCGPTWSVGSKSFFYNCNYTNIENLRFKTVRQQKVVRGPNNIHWEWKE